MNPMVFDSNPPSYIEPVYHRHFCFSNDIATFQVENTLFKVHEHFLSTYSSVFRDIFQRQPNSISSSSSSDNERFKDESRHVIHLDGVTVLEFESLLSFFYESWREGFSMLIANWVALLAIAHRFKFKDAETRARREVFEGTDTLYLGPVKKIFLAEKHNVPTSFIIPSLEALVQRKEPLDEKEVVDLSSEMISRIGVARERYVRESSRMFASESWLKRVAHDIVQSVWCAKKPKEEPAPAEACPVLVDVT